jgi:hypothetical protein
MALAGPVMVVLVTLVVMVGPAEVLPAVAGLVILVAVMVVLALEVTVAGKRLVITKRGVV